MFWVVRWHIISHSPRGRRIFKLLSSLCLAFETCDCSVLCRHGLGTIIAPITTSAANNAICMARSVGRVQTETIQVLSGTGISYASSSRIQFLECLHNNGRRRRRRAIKTSGTKTTTKFLDMEINELLRQWLIEPLTKWSWWINLITPRSPLVQLNL